MDHRSRNKNFQYLVKFKDHQKEHRWFTEDEIQDYELINKYWRTQRKQVNMALSSKDFIHCNKTLRCLLIVMLLFPLVLAENIQANFKYCLANSNIILDTYNSCPQTPEIKSNSSQWHILHQTNNLVNGKAHECLMQKITLTTSKSLFGYEYVNREVINMPLSRDNCDLMIKTRKCYKLTL